ncbi:MAG TPA: hypothetical protein ENI23_10235 [bacterium]|nr:hypothetical protein [bacterium]
MMAILVPILMKTSNSPTIKLVVKPNFKAKVQQKASALGVSTSTYVKHLIINDFERLPEFEASERVIKKYNKARKSDKRIATNGKMISEILTPNNGRNTIRK